MFIRLTGVGSHKNGLEIRVNTHQILMYHERGQSGESTILIEERISIDVKESPSEIDELIRIAFREKSVKPIPKLKGASQTVTFEMREVLVRITVSELGSRSVLPVAMGKRLPDPVCGDGQMAIPEREWLYYPGLVFGKFDNEELQSAYANTET